jgi:hypothetical protein
VGLSLRLAFNRLSQAGLCPGQIHQVRTGGSRPVVVSQRPPAGRLILSGKNVALSVVGPRSWKAFYWMCPGGGWTLTLK